MNAQTSPLLVFPPGLLTMLAVQRVTDGLHAAGG